MRSRLLKDRYVVRREFVALLAVVTVVVKCLGATDRKPVELEVGDSAPQLHVSKWLMGAPVSGFETGTVYVVEFWGSWCASSLVRLSELSKLNTRLASTGTVIIAVNVFSELAQAEYVVRTMGHKINYRVAADDARGRTFKAWNPHIPSAFVIDEKGNIAWRGSSWDELVKVLRKPSALDAQKELLFEEVREATEKAYLAARYEDWDSFVRFCSEQIRHAPELAGEIRRYEFTFMLSHVNKRRDNEAYKLGVEALENEVKELPEELCEMVYCILAHRENEQRFLDLALRMALQADRLLEHQDASILGCLGRVYDARKEWDKAIAAQEAAIEKIDNEVIKARIRAVFALSQEDQNKIEDEYRAILNEYRERAGPVLKIEGN